MMTDGTQLVDTYYRAFNGRDWAAYERLFSAQAETIAPGGGAKGIGAIRDWDRAWAEAFTDAKITSRRKVEAHGVVISENRFSGKHTAPLMTEVGEIPATGKNVDVGYVTVFDIDQGRLKVQRLYYDRVELQTQLGLVGEAMAH